MSLFKNIIIKFIDYYVFSKKGNVEYKHGILFLIYPLVYFIMVNLRVAFGGKPFYDGTLYPYFFIDPTINGQGWGVVCLYIVAIITLFYALAIFYIYLDKKIHQKQTNKNHG